MLKVHQGLKSDRKCYDEAQFRWQYLRCLSRECAKVFL